MKREAKASEEAKQSKFDFSSTVDKIKSSLKDKPDLYGLGSTLPVISNDPKDFIIMPDWWKEYFGIMGLQFGKIMQIAGDSDTGKTSLALEAMLRAQQQGYGIIYVETEGKTGEQDLILKGINPKGVITVSSSITEEAFDGALRAWTFFFKEFPNDKLLLVFDSYGNTISMRDSEIDMTKQDQMPGGAAKTNRMGLNTMIARMYANPVAILIVNYTYGRMDGGRGQVNAGGKALNFFSTLTLQASRLGWIEKTQDKVRVRLGAKVRWKVYKNHYAKTLVDDKGQQILLPSFIDLSITAEGFKLITIKEKEEESDE